MKKKIQEPVIAVDPRPSLTTGLKDRIPNKLGTLLDKDEMFYTMFEPKAPNRFIIHMIDERTKKKVVESYVIKRIDRPGFYTIGGKRSWFPIRLRFYESVVPTGTLFKLLKAGVMTITVNELGPVGDIIETWVIPLCRINSIKPQPLDWSSNAGPLELEVEIDWS